jgi:hypothetical protein
MTGPPDREGTPAGAPSTHNTSTLDQKDQPENTGRVEASPLRQLLDKTAANEGCSLKDLTVLSPQVDPFPLDTPANHRNAEWFTTVVRELGYGVDGRTIHLRGLHYAIAMGGVVKPDGEAYAHNDDNWEWLQGSAAKPARWLPGYIPFEQIHDQRNAEPIRRDFTRSTPRRRLDVGLDIQVPPIEDLNPRVKLEGFRGGQPYRIVMIGEKASLEEVLTPVAERRSADLYLPSGNISDPLVHTIAADGAADGRPMVVLYFADCDMSGWNMAIEVARKLQAFKASLYPELEFRQYRAALIPDQVRQFDLPSMPFKRDPKTGEYADKRATAWIEAMGVEQTEIDALATLRPDLLEEIAEAWIAPFFDKSLERRVAETRQGWVRDAQAVIDNGINQENLEQLRDLAGERLEELQDEIDRINEAARVDADDFDLPPVPTVPAAELNGDQPLPLLDSGWSFADQCRRLINSKAYRS